MKITNRKDYYGILPNQFVSKKIVVGGLMVLVSVGLFAQHGKKGFKNSEITPEQRAELQTKKMALHLDLTEAQQDQVFTLQKENAIARDSKRKEMMALREKGEKPARKNAYESKNAKLDAQLAHQTKMKAILNEAQFETWKKLKMGKAHKMNKLRKHKKTHKSIGEKRKRKQDKDTKEE